MIYHSYIVYMEMVIVYILRRMGTMTDPLDSVTIQGFIEFSKMEFDKTNSNRWNWLTGFEKIG